MNDDDKPTPPAGMPAADMLDPTLESKSDAGTDTAVILEAIGALRRDVDAQIGTLRAELRDTDKRLTNQIGEQASALTQVAKAAATAANMALEAKQTAGNATNEMQAMIEGALRIHDGSIAATIDASVKRAMEPIREENEAAKAERAKGNEALGKLVETFGVEDQVQLGRNVKPGEPKPTPMIPKMSRETKAAAVGSALAFLVIAIEFAMKLLGVLGH